MNPPNLFTYATKELSQDAFICWLAAWTDTVYKKNHSLLHETARHFITSLFEGTGKELPEYDKIKISKEVRLEKSRETKRIDILLELIKKDANCFCILIEDKINAKNP